MADGAGLGKTVTKERMRQSFLANVKTQIQSAIVWDTGNRPDDGTTQTMSSATPGAITTASTPGGISAIALGTGTLGEPGVDKITDSIITAAQLATVLVNYTSIWTSIRKVRLQVFENNSTSTPVVDETQVAHLTANSFEQSNTLSDLAADDDVESDAVVDASNYNEFTSALYNQWSSLKDNVVEVQEVFCHSSCHSSCHGSRGRR